MGRGRNEEGIMRIEKNKCREKSRDDNREGQGQRMGFSPRPCIILSCPISTPWGPALPCKIILRIN